MRLDLGCGEVREPGWTGVDIVPPADLLGDARALPFRDGSFERVRADNVCEHFDARELVVIFREAYRVLADGGVFEVIVPGADLNLDLAMRDPTHLSFWTQGRLQYLHQQGTEWRHGRRAGYPPFSRLGAVWQSNWAWRFELVK